MRYDYKIFADYSQVFVQDLAESNSSESLDWVEEDSDVMLLSRDNMVIVETLRSMEVPFSIEICQIRPEINQEEWDHINQCGIDIASGILKVSGTTDYEDDYHTIEIDRGLYGALICYGGLRTVSEDGLEGADHYKMYLWKEASRIEQSVIKQYLPR